MTAQNLIVPSGCRWCGLEQREHFQRWKPPVGWHVWEPPTKEQIGTRMRERRAAVRPQGGEAPEVAGEGYGVDGASGGCEVSAAGVPGGRVHD
ncbi:hypothetical protein ACFYY8_31365 [Streptosporangium sp. NPDC001559]|uniref:hypothetical protein n=1 Tax=Streptosporangium sp. NPDC001559 TaxID=3366187 RepID=UPI0036EA50A0